MDFDKLKTAMGELEEETVMAMLNEVMADGGSEAHKALEALQQGMSAVGDLFETGEYFVGDLIYSGEVMTEAVKLISPALSGEGSGNKAKMIFCTVKGDIHDIGKNIVKSMLEADGFDVIDLGVDVAPATIIERAKADGVGIIALSGVLTVAIDAMKDTVKALESEGMRASTKIIIGGNPVTEAVCESVGADAWAVNPQKTVATCRQWAAN